MRFAGGLVHFPGSNGAFLPLADGRFVPERDMEQQRRFLAFFAISMGIMLLWQMVVVPKFFPQWVAKPQPAANKKVADAKPGEKPADKPGEKAAAPAVAATGDAPAASEPQKPAEPAAPELAFPEHAARTVKLGSIEADSKYRLFVTLSTLGGAVAQVELNSPRYRELGKGGKPLRLMHPGGLGELSFVTAASGLPKGLTIEDRHWEVIEETPSAVTFRLATSAPGIELTKRYTLTEVQPNNPASETAAYELGLEFKLKNSGKEAQLLQYDLTGPVGVPLENAENTTKFRDITAGFREPTYINTVFRPASSIASGDVEDWTKPFAFIGVDVQYFAALLFPVDDQTKTPYFKVARQLLVGRDLKEKSEVTFRLSSVDIPLEPGAAVTNSFRIYAGPKAEAILPAEAREVVQHGRLGWLSRPMLSILNVFYALTGSYGLAIIGLTIVVRACMLPLSLKQAKSAAVMQEVQKKIAPEMEIIKKTYANDQQKQSQAIMELYRKYNFNPFSMLGGCFLVFLQLPIFMALYSALNLAVDLRNAPFLWAANLAAPDSLFQFPFRIPLLGWTELNVLPFITVGLFLVQQQMFMPPPTSEEQAMQYKMMNFMTVFMGIMFYRVPAGLCVYFIASSIWGLVERKMLPKPKITEAGAAGGTVIDTTATPVGGATNGDARGANRANPAKAKEEPKEPGLWQRLLEMADKEQQFRRQDDPRPQKKKRK